MDPNFFEFGWVQRTHGNQGFLRGVYEGRHPEQYKDLESVFLFTEEGPVPFFFEKLQWQGNTILFKFRDIDTVEDASNLVGMKILLPDELLPELPENDFFLHDLIGMEIVDRKLGKLGKVVSYFDQTAQPLIEIDYHGKPLLLPLAEELTHNIDLQGGSIEISLPDGYIETLSGEK